LKTGNPQKQKVVIGGLLAKGLGLKRKKGKIKPKRRGVLEFGFGKRGGNLLGKKGVLEGFYTRVIWGPYF